MQKQTSERIGNMGAIIGILMLCAAMLGGAAWLLNRPERPSDPEEDEEQERYLTEWKHKHKKK
mgnify:CR=1 FL=1